MSILPKSQRSPKEEFLYSNFPEVATVSADIGLIYTYAQKVQEAINAYNDRRAEKVYLNIAELRNVLETSHNVCDVLGRAPNVCYDILINIRAIQEGFNDLLYSHTANGNEYVSTEPYNPSNEVDKNAI
jgi:hypothetical protein